MFSSDEQDAMWERIASQLRQFRIPGDTPCSYYGCLPDEWITYEKAAPLERGSSVWLVERGEACTCITCGETVYRRVEWSLEQPLEEGESWAA